MKKTVEEMEKEIEFLENSIKTAKSTAVCLADRIESLEKEVNFYKAIIKYLIRY